MNLHQIAQEATDSVLGKGTYKRLNKFDPSQGETRQASSTRVRKKEKKPRGWRQAKKKRKRTFVVQGDNRINIGSTDDIFLFDDQNHQLAALKLCGSSEYTGGTLSIILNGGVTITLPLPPLRELNPTMMDEQDEGL